MFRGHLAVSTFVFLWQAWLLVASIFVLRSRRGTYDFSGTLGHTWAVAGDAAQPCMAGVAFGNIYLGFAWQAWHLAISTLVLYGKRGGCSHPPSFCVAGEALMALGWLDALGRAWSLVLPLNFTWQAWYLAISTLFSHGRRGT